MKWIDIINAGYHRRNLRRRVFTIVREDARTFGVIDFILGERARDLILLGGYSITMQTGCFRT